MTRLKQRSISLYNWFELRLGLGKPVIEAAEHEIPGSTSSWWYVFGSAASVILGLQVVTGILLALVYTPSASNAWNSLQFLGHNIRLGWFFRAIHGWGSDFMIAIVLIHMVQGFLFGAYKFPRELTWIVGVFLLLLTLGMAFTGQVLRFDQDSYWGLGIGASILSRVPFIGGALVDLTLGGPIIAGPTLTRFIALHVFVIPGILLALVGLHVWMVLRLGINEWPMPGRIVRKSTSVREYNALTKETGIPFVPDAVWKDAFFAAAIMLAVIAVTLGVLTRLGMYTPWSPIMNAWTSDPIPIAYLNNRTPLEREGAIVFQNKQCRNCHSIGGEGGLRGPALDSIATRMTEDQIIRQVLQGGGNMPAYGNSLNPSETTALVRFLTTLRGNGLAPAIDASRNVVLSGKLPSTVPNGH